jgi:hypothetical protein
MECLWRVRFTGTRGSGSRSVGARRGDDGAHDRQPLQPDVSLTDGLRQLTGRIVAHPLAGLVIGGSTSRGRFLTDEAVNALPSSLDRGVFTQRALGADVEYSRDYYLLRFEAISSRWTVPLVQANPSATPLDAVGLLVEGRYKIRPAVFAGARFDHLRFSQVTSTGQRAGWEAPVSRIETGVGYALQRNLQIKVAFQHNTRATSRAPNFNVVASQLVYWF